MPRYTSVILLVLVAIPCLAQEQDVEQNRTPSTYSSELTTRWVYDLFGTMPIADVGAMGWETHPVVFTEYSIVPSWLSTLTGDLSVYRFGVQGRTCLFGIGVHPMVSLNRLNLGEEVVSPYQPNETADSYNQGIAFGIGLSYKPLPYTVFALTPKVLFSKEVYTTLTADETWLTADLGVSIGYRPWIRADLSVLNLGTTQQIRYEGISNPYRVSRILRFGLWSSPSRFLRAGFEYVTKDPSYLIHYTDSRLDNTSYGALSFTGILPFAEFGGPDGAFEVRVAAPVIDLPDSYIYDNGARYGLGVAYKGFFANFDVATLSGDPGESVYIMRAGYELIR
jgi:hypothetical protein